MFYKCNNFVSFLLKHIKYIIGIACQLYSVSSLCANIYVHHDAIVMNGSDDNGNLSASFSDNDSLILEGNYNITTGGDIKINEINTTGNIIIGHYHGIVTCNHNVSVVDSQDMDFVINEPINLTLDAGSFSASVTFTSDGVMNVLQSLRQINLAQDNIGTIIGSVLFGPVGSDTAKLKLLHYTQSAKISDNIFAYTILLDPDTTIQLFNRSNIVGNIITESDNNCILDCHQNNIIGNVGTQGNALKEVLSQDSNIEGDIYAYTVSISQGQTNTTVSGLITGTVHYTEDGSLIADKGISGAVTTATTNTGTLTIGLGDVSGAIGSSGAILKQVLFNGVSSVTSVDATTLTVNNANANVTATGDITAAVNYMAAGKLTADSGITGNVDFAGNNGVLQLAAGQTITGNVDSSTAVGGTLEFLGAGTVTGTIGATNALTALKYSGAGANSIPAAAKAETIEVANAGAVVTATALLTANVLFSEDGSLIADNGITGNVDFAGNNGVLQLAAGQTITGNIDSGTAVGGTLELLGSGTIGGVISNISIMKAGAGDVTFAASGDYTIGELQGNGSGIITFPSSVNFTGGINTTGGDPTNFSFTGNTSITGNIGSSSSPVGNISSNDNTEFNGDINSSGDITTLGTTLFAGDVTCNNIIANRASSNTLSLITLTSAFTASSSNTINFDQDNAVNSFQGQVSTTGNIEVNGSTYFADTVNSGGNVIINGDTKFNKTLSSSNNVTISNSSNVIFNGDVSSSSINIDNASIKVVDNISMQGNISANNSTVILDNNTLTLSGANSFSNQLTISSIYDESSLSGGNIILTSGSTLDLSNVSELIIKLAFINSDISKINDDTKYNIILAEDGSNIILLSDPDNQIILDSSGEQNKFVKWTLDANSLTLYASDNSNNVIDNDYVFDSEQDNIFMQELKRALPGSISQEFKNNIGLLSKEQVEEMLSRILDYPKERNSEITYVALQQALIDTQRTAMNAIHNRLLDTSPTAVAAGDEDLSKYGVWVRSSINHSKDKVSGKNSEYFSSYKTRGHSNTIGFDGLISDNLLLGIAYTNAYTNIRPQDQNIGNVDKVRTNMFSLYSAYNIPNYDWYVDGTISYAESSIRSGKIRNLAMAKNILGSEVASSKYKSYLYSGSVSLGYNYNLNNNIYVTPSLGAIGSLIRDKGYEESGTSFQNLTVHKKNYNKLSGVAGLRAYRDIYLASVDNVIITPEAYGFINYDIKNKIPAIDARLAGIDERLPTINYRSNRLDYNLGLGITVKHRMMEYGINYDANLAKKYQGHSGSLKLRVNL